MLDFYQGAAGPGSVHVDVRPAVSWGGLVDRGRHWWNTWVASSPSGEGADKGAGAGAAGAGAAGPASASAVAQALGKPRN